MEVRLQAGQSSPRVITNTINLKYYLYKYILLKGFVSYANLLLTDIHVTMISEVNINRRKKLELLGSNKG